MRTRRNTEAALTHISTFLHHCSRQAVACSSARTHPTIGSCKNARDCTHIASHACTLQKQHLFVVQHCKAVTRAGALMTTSSCWMSGGPISSRLGCPKSHDNPAATVHGCPACCDSMALIPCSTLHCKASAWRRRCPYQRLPACSDPPLQNPKCPHRD